MIDQPTAANALKQLEQLLGEWTMVATPPGGPSWPGEARTTFEWMAGDQLLLVRSTIEIPEAPNGISVIGCDGGNGTYTQVYTDDRGVCRIYGMSIGDGEWRLWREGDPFDQRFTGRFSDDGDRIDGQWEARTDDGWEIDFQLVYTRVR